MTRSEPTQAALPRASLADTLATLADVILPTLGKGVLIRRPRAVALAQRLDLDARAVARLDALRAAYGDGPLLLAVPFRPQALVLAPEDARRVLAETPEPFAAATKEKRSALTHFEPGVSLVSSPPLRAARRRLNDEVLQSACPRHDMAATFAAVIDEEMVHLRGESETGLDWPRFAVSWWRMVRTILLGRGAREDSELTDMLAELRAAGNWAFLHPRRRGLLRRFRARLAAHLAREEAGSLAPRVRAASGGDSAPLDQVAHWLFAFDAGAIATWRALALVASDGAAQMRLREEAAQARGTQADRPYAKACIRESIRLWPTTPVILRESLRETSFRGASLPAHTQLVIFVPYFHRSRAAGPQAQRFAPENWLAPEPLESLLIPFSAGPGTCPAHHLLPLVGAIWLGALLERRAAAMVDPQGLRAGADAPASLDPFTLAFRLSEISPPARH